MVTFIGKKCYTNMSSRYRKVVGVSLNPAEHDAVQTLMSHGGYPNFSEFAKAKILGVASESEKRLRDLETAVENMSHSNARHHAQWVDAVKRVSGSDAELLVAAIYALLHMMARPQDKAVMDQDRLRTGQDDDGRRQQSLLEWT